MNIQTIKDKITPCSSPFFSIIIPVYNVEKYLPECLNSVFGQTFSDYEVICIEDGSTDHCLQILNEFSSQYDNLKIIAQDNQGVSVARNIGINTSIGRYLIFIDADDYIELNTLEILQKQICKYNADILVFGGESFPAVKWIDEKLNVNNVVYTSNSIYALLYEIGSLPFACNKVYKRSLIIKHNCKFEESLALGEDQAFQFLTFPFADRIVFCAYHLYHYRQTRLGSATIHFSDKANKTLEEHLKVATFAMVYWDKINILVKYGKDWSNWCLRFLYESIKMADEQRSREAASMVISWGEKNNWYPKLTYTNKRRYTNLSLLCKHKLLTTDLKDSVGDINAPTLFLSQKIQGGITCYQEFGFMYVLKLVFRKILKKIKGFTV